MTRTAAVERLFSRLSHHEVPVWIGASRGVSPEVLEAARATAFERAEEADRGGLLRQSLARVDRAFTLYAGDQGYWTGVFGVPVPVSSVDRATSQRIVEDLVTAVVVEDLVPESVAATLRADGERLLRLGNEDEPAASSDDGGPPVEPFRGPLVAATITGGIVLAAAWGWVGGALGGIIVAVIGIIILLARQRRR